ncbi:hypothetical protein [Streptomyces malaysiensis]|uniref:hypothetical protein n=1 Tax=Streptomyces malaysiensis TaxID=92644 RepID=UPI00368F1F9E
MSTGPTIETWTSRNLTDAAVMNRRIRDVNTWLANPPAAKVHGKFVTYTNSSYGLLTFYAPGKETTTNTNRTAFQTVSGMVVVESDGVTVKELKAPKAGRYRLTIGGAATAVTSSGGTPYDFWVYLGRNPEADTGESVANNAVTSGAWTAASNYTYLGTRTIDVTLAAGDRIRAAARMDGSDWKYADTSSSNSYQTTSFLEMRWIGEVP